MRGKRRMSSLSEINVTNLVDVTMVLLIIFILVAPFIRSGIQIQTPEVGQTQPLQSDIAIMIKIDEEGNVFLDDEKVVIEDIGENVARLKQALPEAPVWLEADGKIPYEVPVKVIDRIRSAGVTDISLVTRQAGKEAGERSR